MVKRSRGSVGLMLLLPVLGCGAMPDFVLDTVRDSAKEAFEQQLEELVNQAVGGLLDEVTLPLDLTADEEPSDDSTTADDESSGDEDADTPDRTTR